MSKINLKAGSDPINDYLQMYHAVYDTETKEVTLTCICDGTGSFLNEMQSLLRRIGCVDIKSYSDVNDKYGTEKKPWATCKFTAVGKLPVELYKGEVVVNSYQDSPFLKWLSTMFSQIVDEKLDIDKPSVEMPSPDWHIVEGKGKVDILSNHESEKPQKKKKHSWEFYDYDVGMYRTTGYKCPVCNIEYGDNIYVYKGIPTFEQKKIPFSYCPNCGTKLEFNG